MDRMHYSLVQLCQVEACVSKAELKQVLLGCQQRHPEFLYKQVPSMQLANVERRLAKRGLGGSFARARAFYRAATEELKSCMGALSSGAYAEEAAEALTVSSSNQEDEEGGISHVSQQAVTPQNRVARERGSLPQHQGASPSAGSCPGPDARSAVLSLQSHLVRGLQSWARMEGFLG